MPDNASFYYAAYVAAAVLYVGYTVSLLRRRARTRTALEAELAAGRVTSEPGSVNIRS